MSKAHREVAGWVAFIAILAIFIGGYFYATTQVFSVYRIGSGSMEPTLPVGIEVWTLPADRFEKRDIITFRQGDHLVTHTFIGYDKDGSIMTKGDANPTPDVHEVPLLASDVVGKVAFANPILLPSFWLSPKGIATAAVIIFISFMIYLIVGSEKKSDMDNSEETRELTPSDPSIA